MKRRIKYEKITIFVMLLSIAILVLFFLIKPAPLKMVSLENKTITEIKAYAKKNKLSLKINYANDDVIKKDKIISQSIKPNAIIKADTKLEVTISLGPITKDVYKDAKVNEAGRIPIMMYHGIQDIPNAETAFTGGNIDKDGYQRTAEAFRQDLEFYYKNNYVMIRLMDYVNGIIDVPLGKSPLIITFDDGNANNIEVTGLDNNGNIMINPNSAVGILETFKNKYPDFQVTATFFVNGGLFNQNKYNDKILKWLTANGYDIGNHTYNHATLGTISKEQVEKEIGTLYQQLDHIIPNKYVKIIALPFGSPYTKDHANFPNILNANYNNVSYTSLATLRVGWDADYSPFVKNFNPHYLKRIRAYDNNGKEFDIEMNFKLLEKSRYISDGNKNQIVIPDSEKDNLLATDLKIITY